MKVYTLRDGLTTQVLWALTQKPMTYAALQHEYKFGDGTLIPALKRLCADGLVVRRSVPNPAQFGRRTLIEYVEASKAAALEASVAAAAPVISEEAVASIEPPKPTDFQSREEYLEAVIVQLAQALPAGNELRDYLTDVLTAAPQPA